jgi:hypothetical protein
LIYDHDHDENQSRLKTYYKKKRSSGRKRPVDCATVCGCAESGSELDDEPVALARAERSLKEKRRNDCQALVLRDPRVDDKPAEVEAGDAAEAPGETTGELSGAAEGRRIMKENGWDWPLKDRKSFGEPGWDDDDDDGYILF